MMKPHNKWTFTPMLHGYEMEPVEASTNINMKHTKPNTSDFSITEGDRIEFRIDNEIHNLGLDETGELILRTIREYEVDIENQTDEFIRDKKNYTLTYESLAVKKENASLTSRTVKSVLESDLATPVTGLGRKIANLF